MFILNLVFGILVVINSFVFTEAQHQCTSVFNEEGQCVRLRQCHYLNQYFENNIYPVRRAIIQHVIKYKCGYDYSNCISEDNCKAPILQLKVCCPINPANVDTRINEDQSSDGNDQPNLNLLNSEYGCGEISNANQFGTRRAGLLEFPWLALLKYEIDTDDTFKCSGSLINEKYVLTSAKCAQYNKVTTVVLGENTLFQDEDCDYQETGRVCADPLQKIDVEEIIIHPDYDRSTYLNNIALLRLTRPADFSKNNVKAICLPITNQLMNIDERQRSLLLTGIYSDKFSPKFNVVRANITTLDNRNCEATYNNPNIANEQTQICGANTLQTCDFELPSILQSAVNYNGRIRYVQFGIHSTARSSIMCDSNDLATPDIYTRVSSYINWIQENLKP